jgi:ribosomal-protein-alanine N-acetyltransferase
LRRSRITSLRPGTPADLAAVRSILDQTPEAAQWTPEGHDFLVAESDGAIGGFLVWRHTAPDEVEILNLAVSAESRRRGIAKALIAALPNGDVFLEVRESNTAARGLYGAAGFVEVGVRPAYYQNPPEGAIVMRLQS